MRLIFLFSPTVFFLAIFLCASNVVFSQQPYILSTEMLEAQQDDDDSIAVDQMVRVIEQTLAYYYATYARQQEESYEAVIAQLNYSDGQIIDFSDEVYCQRLQAINRLTPIHIECNSETLSTIRFFATKRRGFIRIVLGRSKLYFDLYEAKLSEYELPLELKYLSVIESGLRPQVKSRAGALGLWQFMYRTGKMFGLNENSYIDERMDPEKSTDAACRYLKYLHSLYNDWNLALAAYNAGPGNVNKAIRRSGNKTTYWEIRPFLPKETQGYIPNFIAAIYMLTYHAQHNIIPAEAPIHHIQLDTFCLSQGVHIATIASLLNFDLNEIKNLNPVYKHDFIPETSPKQCVYLPLQFIGQLTSLEDSLYALETKYYATPTVSSIEIARVDSHDSGTARNTFYHQVQAGETLAGIAQKYTTTVNTIIQLNNLNSTNIYVGQRLKIEGTTKKQAAVSASQTASIKYYTVKSGDTFGKIAQRHGKSISQLKKLNPKINIDRLSLGQKIRIR